MTYFTPTHRLVEGLWDRPDAEIGAQVELMLGNRWGVGSVMRHKRWGAADVPDGQIGVIVEQMAHFGEDEDSSYTLIQFGDSAPVIADLADLERVQTTWYLDCTGKWDQVRKWLEWCYEQPKSVYAMFETPDWPPPNVVLLVRASTQVEYLDRISLRGFSEVGWRTALLLRPVERIELDRDLAEAVDQIIVELPPLFKMRPANMALDSYRRSAVDAIIAQVRAVRRCVHCSWDGERLYKPCSSCSVSSAPGTAPGKPALWVEGDETWKERLT